MKSRIRYDYYNIKSRGEKRTVIVMISTIIVLLLHYSIIDRTIITVVVALLLSADARYLPFIARYEWTFGKVNTHEKSYLNAKKQTDIH